MFIWAIFLESAFLLALGGAVLGLIHCQSRKKRLPFTQKILRPPGESLRIRLIELDDKLNDLLLQLFLSAYSPLIMAGLVALQGVHPGIGVWIMIVVIAAIASTWSAYRLWKCSICDVEFAEVGSALEELGALPQRRDSFQLKNILGRNALPILQI
jgi:hypothetical protein